MNSGPGTRTFFVWENLINFDRFDEIDLVLDFTNCAFILLSDLVKYAPDFKKIAKTNRA
jgi:hypothetical protein